MNYYFLEVEPDGKVDRMYTVAWGGEGQPAMPDPIEGNACYALALPVSLKGPSPTCEPYWQGNALVWIETASLEDLKTAAIARTFVDVDAVVQDAVGDRTHEYELAEQAARAFAAAGYVGECSRFVVSYALNNSTLQEQKNEWAAQNIIARANAFDWATGEMRDKRMYYGVRMQSAATHAELMVAVSAWDGFIAGLRAQLGL